MMLPGVVPLLARLGSAPLPFERRERNAGREDRDAPGAGSAPSEGGRRVGSRDRPPGRRGAVNGAADAEAPGGRRPELAVACRSRRRRAGSCGSAIWMGQRVDLVERGRPRVTMIVAGWSALQGSIV